MPRKEKLYKISRRLSSWQVLFRQFRGIRIRHDFRTRKQAIAWGNKVNRLIERFDAETAHTLIRHDPEFDSRPFDQLSVDAQRYSVQRENQGVAAARFAADEQRLRDAIEATRILECVPGVSLSDAARHYVASRGPDDGRAKTVAEYVESFLADMKEGRHKIKTSQQLEALCEALGEKQLSEVTHHQLTTWLKGLRRKSGISETTYNSYREAINRMFRAAVRDSYVQQNPVAKVKRYTDPETQYEQQRGAGRIFLPDEAEHLLRTAAEHAPELVPYYALGLFGGYRPESALRDIEWRNLNAYLDSREEGLEIEVWDSKIRDNIPQEWHTDSPCLVAWLVRFRQPDGKIVWTRKRHDKVLKNGKITWYRDIMRKSAGSYDYALNGLEHAMRKLGHRNSKTFFRYYHRTTSRRAAESYFNIWPEQKKVVRLSS